jgi:hypothetical protein
MPAIEGRKLLRWALRDNQLWVTCFGISQRAAVIARVPGSRGQYLVLRGCGGVRRGG